MSSEYRTLKTQQCTLVPVFHDAFHELRVSPIFRQAWASMETVWIILLAPNSTVLYPTDKRTMNYIWCFSLQTILSVPTWNYLLPCGIVLQDRNISTSWYQETIFLIRKHSTRWSRLRSCTGILPFTNWSNRFFEQHTSGWPELEGKQGCSNYCKKERLLSWVYFLGRT